MKLDIVIINWNSGNQLENCLRSIHKYWTNAIARVVVVDNASSDRSADGIAQRFADMPAEVICNSENIGFSRACNQGARAGDAPYLLFLNPDAEVFEQSISYPLEYMEVAENVDVGICGVQLVDQSGAVSRTCARFPKLGRLTAQALGLNKLPGLKHLGMAMKNWDHGCTKDVDQVMGSFFIIRRNIFERLGGFDERFFMYFEEVDLSFRAKCAGFKSIYLTEAKAYHAGGGTSHQIKAMRLFYSLRSRLLFGFKHFPLWQAWVLTGVTMIMEPVSRFFFCAFNWDWKGIHNTAKGYRYLWLSLPQIIASRKKGSVQ